MIATGRSLLGAFVCLAMVLSLAACRSAPAGGAAETATVKLAVDAEGVYEVPAAALRPLGFDLSVVRAEELSLTAGGEKIGFQLLGRGRDRALRFFGQAPGPGSYTGRNIYWLSRVPAGTAAIPLETRPAAPTGVAVTDVVSATVRMEEQRTYHPLADPGEDRWYWQALYAPAQAEATLSVPHPVAGGGELRVHVAGNSSAPVSPDHHLLVSLNGVQLADATWDGLGPHSVTAMIPDGVLAGGANLVTLRAPGDTGAPADALLLDWVEVSYYRKLSVDDGGLTFEGEAAGYALGIEGEPAVLWDITDPTRPVVLSDYVSGGGAVRFTSDGTPRRFTVATLAGLRRPATIVAVQQEGKALPDWPGGADMIVVTVPQFREALKPLVAAREAQGLRVAVLDVDEVYDAFNHGRDDPAAIRSLVRHALDRWTPPAPRYLLLAGDASYDPRGYLRGSEVDLVPTQAVNTAYSGWTASDVWYAVPDRAGIGDNSLRIPDVAVGRLPAQTADQLSVMISKILDYEAGDGGAAWRQRAWVMADNDEPAFAVEADAFTAALSNYSSRMVTVAGDGSAARSDLLRAFDEGTGLLGYFGHGSVTLWAREKIFSVSDVSELTNRARLPVIFTITCLSGYFQHPNTPSLGEALLRAPNGGAVAALVPSSAGVLSDQRVLAQALAASLADQGEPPARTLGEAVLQAQRSLTVRSAGLEETLLTFNLLGDPAQPLPR